jgi:murein DD-endopeptidase MepM/ murein hydrolase activator NlpD
MNLFLLIFPSLFPVHSLLLARTMSVKNHFLFLLFCLSFISCNSMGNLFSNKKTPHEVYADKVEDKAAGKRWVALSKDILASNQSIKLPYRLTGYFPAGKPRALALAFMAKRGERISFDLTQKTGAGLIYADIFKVNGEEYEHRASIDVETADFDAGETGQYVLRLQPELENAIEYQLAVSSGPSLGFPVAGTKARVGSVWGDSRDNGKRSHEGIDIFAAKLTPAIAAADGYISSVKEGGLGGKTIHLKVADRNLSLYYAHLDKQLVKEGQYVKKGDTLGLVGNTGNARTTPPHLHFGIYTYGGPIDPLPFVNNKTAQNIPTPAAKELRDRLKLVKPLKTKTNQTINTDAVLIPLGVTHDSYIAELPDGELMMVPLKAVKKA